MTGLAIVDGLSITGYAFGALLGGDLIKRLPQRPLFLACEGLFIVGIALGVLADVLPFWAVGELTGHGFDSPLFTVPMAIGIGCLVAMLLLEYHKQEPLAPVELVRSLADLILAPVMVAVALVASGGRPFTISGLHEAIWITEWATIALTLAGVALFVLGGTGLQRPDLIAWIKENRPAIGSNRLAHTIRPS